MSSDVSPPRPADRLGIPTSPLMLGLAGLLPFLGLAGFLAVTPALGYSTGQIALALSAYGAVIVSFLGGIRWGLVTAAPAGRAGSHFEQAVLPSLLAWGSLALAPTLGLSLLGIAALALGLADRSLVAEGLAPPWYGRLRLILSTGAGAALLSGAALVAVRGG